MDKKWREKIRYNKFINSKKENEKAEQNDVRVLNKKYSKSKTKAKRKKVYSEFLQSNYWKNVRQNILIRDNNSCVKCNKKTKLEVHHKTYKNHGKEHLHLDDLITLCRTCHELEHSI